MIRGSDLCHRPEKWHLLKHVVGRRVIHMTATELRERRQAQGLSLDRLMYRLARRVPEKYIPTKQTVSRWETGQSPVDSDPVILALLCEELGVPLGELSVDAYDYVKAITETLIRSRCDCENCTSGQKPCL